VIFAMELCTARTSRTSDRCLLLSIPGGCSSMEADCAVIAGADSRRRCLPLLPLLLLLLLLPMVVYADETANTQRAVGHSSEATCGLKHLSPQLPAGAPPPAPPPLSIRIYVQARIYPQSAHLVLPYPRLALSSAR
jgi:hypothetical protein